MRRSVPLLFLVIGFCIGCTSPRSSARYGWLRKQDERSVSTAHPDPMVKGGPVGSASDENTVADLGGTAEHCLIGHLEQSGLTSVPIDGPSLQTEPGADISWTWDTLDVQDTSYYDPQAHPWNAKAIASLPIAVGTVVVGLAIQSIYLLLIGGAIAFALGLIASRQCRDRGDRGKGLAMTAMVLGAAAFFFSLMVLITAAR